MSTTCPSSVPGLFSGVLLLTDLDNTLLDRCKQIPARNRAAVRRFQEQGGLFSIATGRGPQAAAPAALAMQVNCPGVTFNGGLLYDFDRDEAAWPEAQTFLPASYRALARQVHERFPQVGLQAYVGKQSPTVVYDDVVRELVAIEHQQDIPISIDALPERAHKVLFGGPPALLREVEAFCATLDMTGMYGLYTAPVYYEWMPVGVSKGSGVLAVAAREGIAVDQVVVTGDYYNDVDMLKVAGYPIVAGNAPADVQTLARFVAGDCDDGVVADAIDHIEGLLRQYGRIPPT